MEARAPTEEVRDARAPTEEGREATPHGGSVRGLRGRDKGQRGPRGGSICGSCGCRGGLGDPCGSFITDLQAAVESNTTSGEDNAGASKLGTG
jgi:hypothetical protein